MPFFEHQKNLLSCQSGSLQCSICKVNLATELFAATSVWGSLLQATIDVIVSKERKAIETDFDRRLQERVREVLASYGDESTVVKMEAKELAAEARNTILNLSCPKCELVYIDFDGCMALSCPRCSVHFCAWCHKHCTNSAGCHDHVRECDLNPTPNGSYFCNDIGLIQIGQKRYRMKEMKKFLKNHKKNIQNAIVIELSKDLLDLEIDPAALIQVGNLL